MENKEMTMQEFRELVEVRKAGERHYASADGGRRTVYDLIPTDYCDEKGNFAEIDDTLVPVEADKSDKEDYAGYENKANEFKVRLAGNLSSGKLMRIRKGDSELCWKPYKKLMTASGRAASRTAQVSGDEGGNGGTVTYRNGMNGADLRYTVREGMVKEEIVIRKRAERYAFEFLMTAKNLTLTLDEDKKTLHAVQNGIETFGFPAPFMTDAAGQLNTDVYYELEEKEEGYLLRVIADETWINAEEREFPVVIDPTITNSSYAYHCVTNVCGVSQYSNRVGRVGNAYYRYQFFFGFEHHKNITSAKVTFRSSNNIALTMNKLLSSYNSGSCCFATTSIVTADMTRENKGSYYLYTADVTEIVRDWCSGSQNYGLVLRSAENGTVNTYTTISQVSLEINYTVDKHTYGQQNLTTDLRRGKSSVDLFTGRHILTREIASKGTFGGSPLTLVYNSDYSNESNEAVNMGPGWRLGNLVGMVGYAYVDGTGREHPTTYKVKQFYNGTSDFDQNGSRKYRSYIPCAGDFMPAGAAMYTEDNFKVESSQISYENGYYALTNNSGNIRKFYRDMDSFAYEDLIEYSYDYYQRILLQIKDCRTGYTANFNYDSSGKLTSVTFSDGTSFTITYQNGRVQKITDMSGSTTYQYSGNYISAAEEDDGYRLNFINNGEMVSGVRESTTASAISESGKTSGTKNGNQWNITYNHKNGLRTLVTDRNGVKTEYFFTSTGKSIAVLENPTAAETFEPARGQASAVQIMDIANSSKIYPSGLFMCNAKFEESLKTHECFGSVLSVTSSGTKPTSTVNKNQISSKGLYVFCCWAKANSKKGTVQCEYHKPDLNEDGQHTSVDQDQTTEAQAHKPHFGIRVKKLNASSEIQTSVYMPFDENNTEWQFIVVPIDLNDSANSLLIEFDYSNNQGTAYVKKGALYFTNGAASYSFGADYSETYAGDIRTVSLYDEYGSSVKEITYKNGEQIGYIARTYKGDSRCVLTETRYEGNVAKETKTNSYDIYGNCTSSQVTAGSLKLISSTEYTAENRVNAERDETGSRTAYAYSGDLMTRASYANGTGVSFNYSGVNLVKVNPNPMSDSTANEMTYRNGHLVACEHGSVKYSFVYDGFGRVKEVKENGDSAKTVTYTDYGSNIDGVSGAVSAQEINFANGFESKAYYDKYGKLLKVKEGSSVVESFSYDTSGKLTNYIDSRGGLSYTYTYRDGRTETETVKSGDDVVLESACLYGGGDLSEPIGTRYSYSGYTDDYTQDKDDFGRVNSETTPLGDVEFTYDGLGRITEREAYGRSETYQYLSNPSVSGYTTPLVNRITYADNSQLRYSYDANGNILRITDESGREIVSYVYDEINRLKRENIYGYKSVAYTYDVRGNITKKEEYAYTVGALCESHKRKTYSYSYDGDRMVSFDGESCVYDENGNPETYRGQTMAWTRGRMLYRYGNKEFYYDATGRRLKKTAPGGYNAIEYLYAGDKLIAEKENGAVTKRYFYDGMGIAGMEYGGNKYYFRKNLQGDVTEIYDESANQVGSYVYDAWGKILSMQGEMAEINPFRYRGYYYDAETGLAMVGQRYYSPELCRFIQPADVSTLNPYSINGLNLYAYANINPIGISKSTNRSHATLHDGSMMPHIVPSLNKFTSGISAIGPNYWNNWNNKWFDTDWPGFFV